MKSRYSTASTGRDIRSASLSFLGDPLCAFLEYTASGLIWRWGYGRIKAVRLLVRGSLLLLSLSMISLRMVELWPLPRGTGISLDL